MTVLACLLLLAPPAADEGYTYPPERRGDAVATFTVRVPEGTGPARVSYTLTVEGGPSLEVEPPQLEDTAGAWSARRSAAWALDAGRVTWTEEIDLEQVKPGLMPLPDVKLRFRDGPAGPVQEVEWQDVLKDVRELPGPTLPPSPAAGPGVARWVFPLIGLAVVLLVVAVVLLRRRRGELPLSADARALRELDRLEHSAGTSGHEWERMFAALSDVLRRYLVERFGLPAFQQTTAEFLRAVDEAPPLVAEKDNLRAVLELCDLAKFAGVHRDGGQWLDAVGQVRTFVRRTAPLPRAAVIPATQAVRNKYSGEPAPDSTTRTN
jgi:hypothetical protein